MSLRELSPRGLLGRLARHTGVYAGGMVLQQATAALLLPLYIGFLSPAEFGIVALAEVLSALLIAVLSLGTQNAVTRYWIEWDAEGDAARPTAAVWWITIAAALALTLLLQLFGERPLGALFRAPGFDAYLPLVLWYAFFTALTQLPRALLRIREQARAFVVFSYATSLGTLLFNVLFVAVLRRGAEGVLIGNLLGAIVSVLACIPVMRGSVRPRWEPAAVRSSLRFALPLVPGAFLDAAVRGFDRWVLDKFVPLRVLGLYSVAMKVANLGLRTLMLTGFKTAWLPFAVRLNTERPDGRERTALLAEPILLVSAVVAVATVLFAEDVLVVLGDGYRDAGAYVTLLAVANLVMLFDLFAWVGLMMGGRTAYGTVAVGAQLVAAVALNLLLVPAYGATGAALAALGSTSALIGVKMYYAQKTYPVPYRWRRIGVLMLTAVAVMALAGSLERAYPGVSLAGFGLKLVALLGFAALAAGLALPGLRAAAVGELHEGVAP